MIARLQINMVRKSLVNLIGLFNTVKFTFGLLCLAWLVTSPSLAQKESAATISESDYEQHIQALRQNMPDVGFNIRVEAPFVVIGDESAEMLEARCRSIRWAVQRLKKQYFPHDPDHIIDIWLFKDKTSYEKNVTTLHGVKPGTPYGYYSSRHNSLVMNISTGGGTLVHELVHPFIERNFPDCPSWFNEGLASLYEQSQDHEGKIVGLTNWRLNGLQRAIAAGTVPTFQTLCETTTQQFYREDPGTNYSQARYLCYYLQQKGQLNTFYHQFVANVEQDPSGYETLKSVLKTTDMPKFKTEWAMWVSRLKF